MVSRKSAPSTSLIIWSEGVMRTFNSSVSNDFLMEKQLSGSLYLVPKDHLSWTHISNTIKHKYGKKNNNKPYKGYHIPYYHKIKENMYRLQDSLPCTPVCRVTLHYNQCMTMSADLFNAEVETFITYNGPIVLV